MVTSFRETIILLFRDLVTNPEETIEFHRACIKDKGHCWWGWWKKPIEETPLEVLSRLADQAIVEPVRIFLFDSGQYKLYSAVVVEIRVAPWDAGMLSPDGDATPSYYDYKTCAVWFKMTDISMVLGQDSRERSQEKLARAFRYAGFPTWQNQEYDKFIDAPVKGFDELDGMKVTLWHVKVADDKIS